VQKKTEKSKNEVILYRDKSGPAVEVRMDEDTVWLDAHQMGGLFGVDRTGIVRHIRNIYESGELAAKSTCAKIAQVAKDGRVRQMDLYNLDMIISVGYRVNSRKATQFRVWATRVLREYLVKGYAFHEKRIVENAAEFERAVRLVRSGNRGSRVSLGTSDRRSAERICTRESRRKRRISSISSSRIIHFRTGTSASVPSCSSFSFREMVYCFGRTGNGR
jgi:hypothetical protein